MQLLYYIINYQSHHVSCVIVNIFIYSVIQRYFCNFSFYFLIQFMSQKIVVAAIAVIVIGVCVCVCVYVVAVVDCWPTDTKLHKQLQTHADTHTRTIAYPNKTFSARMSFKWQVFLSFFFFVLRSLRAVIVVWVAWRTTCHAKNPLRIGNKMFFFSMLFLL